MLLNLSVKTGRWNQTHYHKCYKPAATSPDNVENITPEKYTFRLKCVLKQNQAIDQARQCSCVCGLRFSLYSTNDFKSLSLFHKLIIKTLNRQASNWSRGKIPT